MNICPSCGEPSEEFREGYCVPCCESAQASLDTFNADHDHWNTLTDQQRDDAIKQAAL